jgi:hypothetical protein
LVDIVHEGYIAWALIAQNMLTEQTYRDTTTTYNSTYRYSSATDPRIVCAPQVCVGSVKLYNGVQYYSITVNESIYIKCNVCVCVSAMNV